MTAAHWHLLVNHIPILGNVFCIVIFIWAFIRKKKELTFLVLGLTVLVAVWGYVADYTGGPAHQAIKGLAGVNEDAFKEHTEAADWALNFMYISAAAALVSIFLLWKNKKAAKYFIILTFLLTVFTSTILFKTGYYGGLVRHPEIENTAN